MPPGHGEFALIDMVRVLDAIGSRAPIGLEVCSAALWAVPAEQAAASSADTTRAVLAKGRS